MIKRCDFSADGWHADQCSVGQLLVSSVVAHGKLLEVTNENMQKENKLPPCHEISSTHTHTEGAVTELSTPGVMTPFMPSAVTG